MKNKVIEVQNVQISISKQELDDYICITDIAKAKIGESRSSDVVKNWLRNRNTLEYLGTCQRDFNQYRNGTAFQRLEKLRKFTEN